ncbi:hypothetical protein L202_03296 [Cryptococcus amylolentus CBS 6039]|uniref:Uncharacterized protein n=2 Tax=Cryptococcus amylolentus TaxID=104669 RepID=A0A1E3HT14_9TREE|nr:hypothetical protein L202_03296 [Cryptococcus amylolentus CBS 6039]ODN79285.1 hypothetical protein L202_03296 [Cryptococcus amylolentus CBS 6039]ODO07689.1 hypothetical protein I350_03260 [Cryptococcus amylolentus CBS 6273]
MSNASEDPMVLHDENSFLFYNPSANDYTSFPTDIPHFLSASAQVYAENMDTDLGWPENQENTLIELTDLNQGTLENIQQQEQSEPVSQRQLSEVQYASRRIRQMYDDQSWGEKGPEFQELLRTWNESVRALQEAGITELPDPPE